MLNNKTYIFENAERTAYAVGKRIVDGINRKKEESNEPFNLALSGGSTPNIMFGILAGELKDAVDWNSLRLFWVDERCVPPTDSESNYGVAMNLLLSKVPLNEKNIFRMRGEDDPKGEAIRYAGLLDEHLDRVNDLPQFDMVLLGMGDDGHTASIFSNGMGLLHVAETVSTAQHPVSGQVRVTLTGNVIRNARELLFVVTGRGKVSVLDEIVHEKDDFERYPSYYILAATEAELYLDREAAEKL